MKPALLALLLIASHLHAEDTGTGRYRLLSARVTNIGADGSQLDLNRLFKIDTQTGETWMFVSISGDDHEKGFEGWKPIKQRSGPMETTTANTIAQYETFIEWATEHKDGYKGTDGEPSYTADQIKKRRAEVQSLLDGLKAKSRTQNAP